MILLFLIGILGLGRFLLNSLHLTWRRAEAWALVVLFGYYFGAWGLLLACSLLGFKSGAALVVGLMLGVWLLPQTRRPPGSLPLSSCRQTAVWLVTTGALSLVIGYILYRHMLDPGLDGAYSAGEDSSDLPLHLSIMSNVAYATRFNWHFSLLAGAYLTYPFLNDFLSGMMVRWGASLRLGLLLTSIPLCLSLVQLLFFLGDRALRSVRAAALFTTVFLMGGSSFGFTIAVFHFLHDRPQFRSFLGNHTDNYSCFPPYDFNNFICNLLPQRSFQFGLPVFCAVMLLIYQLGQEKAGPLRRRILAFIGVLIGLLPLAHVHSFFMSFTVLAALALLDRKTAGLREWMIAIVTSLAIGLPQIAFQLWSNPHKSFVHIQPGWALLYDRDFPNLPHPLAWTLYILANFGVILALTVLSYRILKGHEIVRILVILGAAIFLSAFLFMFQPNINDNVKFLFYAYLFFCLAVAWYLSRLSHAGKWQWALCTGLLLASGTLSTIWQARQHWLLYPRDAFAKVTEYRGHLPDDALVLASNNYANPLWSLAGQPVVEGSMDYLWDYGLSYEQVSRDVRAMYAGGDGALRLLRKYRVQYVLISHDERQTFRIVNEPFFSVHFPRIYQSNGMSIYRIREAS